MGNYEDWSLQYIICSDPHKMEEYCYDLTGYIKRKEKICAYITAKCANCARNHTANSPWYMSKYKADLKVKKQKKKISLKIKKMTLVENIAEAKSTDIKERPKLENKHREKSPLANTEIELESSDWTQDTETKDSKFFVNKNQNYSKNYKY